MNNLKRDAMMEIYGKVCEKHKKLLNLESGCHYKISKELGKWVSCCIQEDGKWCEDKPVEEGFISVESKT